MSILRNILISLTKSLKKLKLVDRCLIIFMIILMTESIYNLFSGKVNHINSNDIDIIIRTTTAAIFGYFLSGNFIRKSKNKVTNCPKEIEVLDDKSILPCDEKTQVMFKEDINNKKEIIEFTYNQTSTSIDDNKNIIEEHDNDNKKELNASNQQIIIATIIGITALIVLILARNSIDITEKSISTIAQMRDFVSGCVGFLLGCPIKTNN